MSINDEDLDYEMDEDAVDDELLELHEETEEFELLKQTSVSPVNETRESSLDVKDLGKSSAAVLPEVIVYPPRFQASDDFWPRSILTYNNLMNSGLSKRAAETLESTKLTDKVEPVKVELLKTKKEMIQPEKVRTKIIENKHMNSDVMELDTPFTSKDMKLETEEDEEVHILSQGSLGSTDGVSIHPLNNSKITMLLTQKLPKKSVFIIHAQQNGITNSRKVLLNPAFDGFTRQDETFNSSITDLRQVVANKRKLQADEVESRPTNKEKVCYSDLDLFESPTNKGYKELSMDIQSENENNLGNDEQNFLEDEKLKQLSTQIENETDEEKKYLLQIEKQKIEREQLVRQKETKRKLEGWRFH